MNRPLPWYFWAVVAVCGLLLLLVLVPPLRVFAIEAVTALFAGIVGARSVQRRRAARDEATQAVEDHREASEVEALQTESRQERATGRVSDASSEVTQSDAPESDKEREKRAEALGADPLA